MSLINKKCVPCEGYENPLIEQEEDKYLAEIPGWDLSREGTHKLLKEYKMLHFKDSISFTNQIADIAESEGHHPNICINFNYVNIELYTHAINGLSENDFILAAKIDGVYNSDYSTN
jgi:4a-hydroxytetrahydrobiopterin dehydratase